MIKTILLCTVASIVMLVATLLFVGGITRKWNNEKRWAAIKWTVVPMSTLMTLLALYITDFI
ncbi:hypothetical protein HU147_10110 [Planomicrobium chinense]|uniref:hypothetical protein n=1 Tax=Planococcus chinensis TaxID=272917 RepID=UPI001CC4F62E|nr:hypothetical protein [Planococcus chinensis]MBZ5201569.1 hypothetical protein [Planococcus chinensis]